MTPTTVDWKTLLRDRRWVALAVLAAVLVAIAYQRPAAFALDLTSPAHGVLLEGWFLPEQGPRGPFRWTTSPATLRLPAQAAAWQPARAVLTLSAPRPEGEATPVPVEAWVNGRRMQSWQVGSSPEEHAIDLEPGLAGWTGAIVLELRAPTFTVPSDLRPLSMLVEAVRVELVGEGWHWPPPHAAAIIVALTALVYLWLRSLGISKSAATLTSVVVLAASLILVLFARPWAVPLTSRALLLFVTVGLAAEATLFQPHHSPSLRTYRLVAFGLRLAIAHTPGDRDNFIAFKMMLENVTRYGVARAYDLDPVVGAYPPLHHYLLAAAGNLYWLLASPELDMASRRLNFVMKIPTIMLDMAILATILRYALGRTATRRALLIGLAYAFNPGIVYVVAYHGQLGDPLFTLGVLLGVAGILAGRGAVAGAGAAAGLLTKPQAAAFAPFLLIAGLRHLRPPRALARAVIAGSVVTVAVLTPFVLAGTVPDMVRTVSTTIGHGPRISSLAFNLWWLVGWGRVWSIKDTELLLGLVPYRTVGLVLYFGLAQGLIVWKAWTARRKGDLALLAAFAGMAFFMLPTQIHENYLFPTFALLAIAAVHDTRAWRLTGVLMATWTVNLITYDPTLLGGLAPGSPSQISPLFALQLAMVLVNGAVFVVWLWWVLRLGRDDRPASVSRSKMTVQ